MNGRLRAWAGLLALALPPLVFRGLSILEEPGRAGVADLLGVLSDLGVACLLLAVLGPVARLSRWLALPVVAFLALGAYANYETIAALGTVASVLDLHFLSDTTFLSGSVSAVASPFWLAGVLVASVGLAAFGLSAVAGRRALSWAVAGAVVIAVSLTLPVGESAARWRTVNVAEHNVEAALLSRTGNEGWVDPPAAMLERLPELAADFDGKPRFAWDGAGRNVLLVITEGVSGDYVPTAADEQRRRPILPMHQLDRIFREGMGYTTFITHNRRTNRGLYAILCGELPGLVTTMAKMTEAATRPWTTCLPEILHGAGYHTTYLQAAPLAFMVKDRFMARIGFQEVLGHKWFERYYLRSKWGVDDRAFFEQAAEKIGQLEEDSKPWFLTLLTVGTHHPYTVPLEYRVREGRDVQGAFGYLDVALGEFARRLEKLGVRDDTLVIFLSDESAGDWGSAPEPYSGRLTQNWGYSAVLVPERHRELVHDPYAQVDVAASILDYLGLADRGRHFFGRSMFRSYDRGRYLFFGNVNRRSIGALAPDGRLMDCEYEGYRCHIFEVADGRPFEGNREQLPDDPEFEDLVRDMARRSRPPPPAGELAIPLLTDPRFTVDMRDWQLVMGVSQLSLDPDEWLEVDYEIQAKGEGRVELDQYLRMRGKTDPFYATWTMVPGQTLRARYTLASDERIAQLGIRTNARLVDGWSVGLEFRRRRLVLHRGGARPEPGVHIDRFELDPPDQPPKLAVMSPEEIDALARQHTALPEDEEFQEPEENPDI